MKRYSKGITKTHYDLISIPQCSRHKCSLIMFPLIRTTALLYNYFPSVLLSD